MATGGIINEEDDYSELDVFECSVCLESLIDRHPRLLHCGHTFCTPCLKSIVFRNAVCCPKCRHQTKLTQDDVELLPKNLDILKVWERDTKLEKHGKNHCQMCRGKTQPLYMCFTCNNRLVCEECNKLHTTVPALKDHHIIPLQRDTVKSTMTEPCTLHNESIEYFCSQCMQVLCVVCISGHSHTDHKDNIMDLESGLQAFQQSLDIYFADFVKISDEIDTGKSKVVKDLRKVRSTKEELILICKNIEQKLENNFKKLSQLEEPLETVILKLEKQKMQMEEIKVEKANLESEEGVHVFTNKTQDLYKKVMQLQESSKECLASRYTVAEYTPGTEDMFGEIVFKEQILQKEQTNRKEKRKKKAKKSKTEPEVSQRELKLDDIELVLDIKDDGVMMKEPKQIINVGDGSVLVVGKHYIHKFNTEGKIVTKYDVEQNLEIRSACVFGRFLFIGYAPDQNNRSLISRINLNIPSMCETFRQKWFQNITRIIATDENKLLVCQNWKDMELMDYNILTNKVTMRDADHTPDVKPFYFIKDACVVSQPFDKEVKYLLRFGNTIKLYDKNWKLIDLIEHLRNPCGIAITPEGNILTMDLGAKTFKEYSLDGRQLRRRILSDPSDKIPFMDIGGFVYHPPHLWILKETMYVSRLVNSGLQQQQLPGYLKMYLIK